MSSYLIKRLLLIVPTAFGVSVFIFVMLHTIPGDYATALLMGGTPEQQMEARPEDFERVRKQLGLDGSLPSQYARWVGNFLQGDLGTSWRNRQPVLERMAAETGDPRIEELPIPLGVTTYDLVSGQPRLITQGRLLDAIERSIAVPFFFPPQCDADGVWCDAGPWESVPVSLARQFADLPVIGVWADLPKPAFLASRIGASWLRLAAATLGVGSPGDPLTARRYLALVASRWAEPVVRQEPDLMIRPSLGLAGAWQFERIDPMIERGYRAARLALAEHGLAGARPHRSSAEDTRVA
jgi:predicted acylesterase/phospholipase RssA